MEAMQFFPGRRFSAAPASMSPSRPPVRRDRPQSLGEEIANSISHGMGLVGAIVGTPFLIVAALQRYDALSVVAASIFAASMLALYLASTLYHAIAHERAKRVLRFFDHSAIYLLIAGTYTPFALGALRGPWGWTILALIWTLALLGIAAKIVFGMRFPRLSTWLYLGMGWIVVIAIEPMWRSVPGWGLFWLAAGGLAYTLGVIFYATDHRIRYHHFVWHLFVLTGTACHYFAVLWYAA